MEEFKKRAAEYERSVGTIPKYGTVKELQSQLGNLGLNNSTRLFPTPLHKTISEGLIPINPQHLHQGTELEAVRDIDGNDAGSQLPLRKGDRLIFVSVDPPTNLLKVVQHIGKDYRTGFVSSRDVKYYEPLVQKEPTMHERKLTSRPIFTPAKEIDKKQVRITTLPKDLKVPGLNDSTLSHFQFDRTSNRDDRHTASDLYFPSNKRSTPYVPTSTTASLEHARNKREESSSSSRHLNRGDQPYLSQHARDKREESSSSSRPFNRGDQPYLSQHERYVVNPTMQSISGIKDKVDIVQLNSEMVMDYIEEIAEVKNLNYRSKVDFLKGINKLETDLRNHKKEMRILKRLYEDTKTFLSDNYPGLTINVVQTISEAERLSLIMTSDLKNLKLYFSENKVTMTQLSSKNAAQLRYIKFTGTIDLEVGKGPHLYEFLTKLRSNFQVLQVEEEIRGNIIKENLSAAAKILIPESLENESQIIRILEDNFGGVTHILNQLKRLHVKLGIVPDPRNSQGALQLQRRADIASGHYILIRRAEVILEHKSEACDEVYSSHHLEAISKYLPINDQLSRGRTICRGGESYKALMCQFEDIFLTTSSIKNNSDVSFSNISHGNSNSIRPIVQQSQSYNFENHRSRRPRDISEDHGMLVEERTDCQICQFFQAEGTNSNYFKNHISSKSGRTENWSCPLYVKLPMKEKLSFLERNNICKYCLSPESNIRNHKMPFEACRLKILEPTYDGRPKPWKCSVRECDSRNELCIDHIERNRPSLERRREALGRHNIDFVFLTDNEAESKNTYHSFCNDDVSIMKRPLLLNGYEDVTLNFEDLPRVSTHQTILLSMEMKGATRGLNVLFDTGCTTAVVKDCIPGIELKALWLPGQQSLLQGLGGSTKSGETYNIALPLANGGHTFIRASAVKEIAKPLKLKNTLPAFQVLKQQAYNNETVQQARIQSISGGEIDILLGMRYISLFPQLVFQSEEGLGLYKLQLLPNDEMKTYCLGGSYKETKGILAEQEHLLCFFKDMEQVLPIFDNPTNEIDVTSSIRVKKSVLKELKEIFPERVESHYKCPSCKGCKDCKRGDINIIESIKDEREEELLRNSIIMNNNTSKFEAKLPILGKADVLLKSNNRIATDVLRSQLRKLQNKPEDIKQIKEGFDKLLNKGYIENLRTMPKETQEKVLNKNIRYTIPWTVAYKPNSQSTPVRIVFNASFPTSSGKSLNDILPTGKVNLALDKIALNFTIAPVGIVADISKFYNSFDLSEEDYHLQLMLWNKDMDPNGEIETYVIKTLIYGVRCVSRQTEIAMEKLASMYAESDPEFSRLLTERRYVDDMSTSEIDNASAERLIDRSDAILKKHGLVVKGWSISGKEPNKDLTNDGVLCTAGYKWDPILDRLFIQVPELHFGSKKRGRIIANDTYTGTSEEDMRKFVPEKLTLRQVTSKTASIFDIRGLISPLMSNLKMLLRESALLAKGDWDYVLPEHIRSSWIDCFLDLEKVREISFPRCMLKIQPSSFLGTLWTFADAGPERLQFAIYISFPLKTGGWSSQFLVGKNHLCPRNITIPNAELQSAHLASLTTTKVITHLEAYVVRSILCVDSEIILYWLRNEKKPLGIFQRNRVSKIKECFEVQDLFHVSGKLNPSDVGTKGRVSIDEVKPTSTYFKGPDFIQDGLEAAIEQKKIISASRLSLSNNCLSSISDGYLEKVTDDKMLMVDIQHVNKVKKRYEFSHYLVDPISHSYPATITILSVVLLFIKRILQACIKNKCSARMASILKNMIHNGNKEIIPIDLISTNIRQRKCSSYENKLSLLTLTRFNFEELNSLKDTAQWYYMKKASRELDEFYPKELLLKHGGKVNGIWISNSRWNDSCQLQNTLGNDITLSELQINSQTPIVDRFSPIGISIAKHIHEDLTIHKGVDFSHFASLSHVYILYGAQLMKEIVNDCIFCKKKLKQCFKQSMGPLNSAQLSIGSIMYIVQIDMSGPYMVKLKKNIMSTRGRPAMAKVWLQHSICVMSHITHTEVIEDYGSESFLCGLSRLSSIYGIPKKVLIDGDSAEIAALTKTITSLRSCFNKVQKELGIEIEVCAAGGSAHSRHGLVEKRVHLTKEVFEKLKINTVDLSILGFQQLCYEVSNLLNSFPLGFVRKHGQTNSARLITPNHFKIGRSNIRTLGGSFEYPTCRQSVLSGVQKLFQGLATYINTVAIPGLLLRPKWYKDDDKGLVEGDIVLFQKKESPMDKEWKMGIVDSIKRGGGNRISLVEINYSNASEITLPLSADQDSSYTNIRKRITRRDIRTVCKIFSLSDPGINKDIAELSKWLRKDENNTNIPLSLPINFN